MLELLVIFGSVNVEREMRFIHARIGVHMIRLVRRLGMPRNLFRVVERLGLI